jgi:hypothetical protein
VIITVVECNLAIISAAYPSLKVFMNQVSTGFLAPGGTLKDSQSRSKSGQELDSMGKGRLRSGKNRLRDSISGLGESAGGGKHAVTIEGDSHSLRSFGSQAIMVRRSVEVEAASLAES